MNLTEKVAYLKGLIEGLSIEEETPEGKLFTAVLDVLDDMALTVTELEESVTEMEELVDIIDEDLGAVEEDIYEGDFDDEDYYEVDCPNCGDTLMIDESVLEEGVIQCPGCKQKFALDLSDDCCCGDGDEDGCGCGCEEHDHD